MAQCLSTVGRVTASQKEIEWTPTYPAAEGSECVIMVRGATGTALDFMNLDFPYALADAGYGVFAHDFASNSTWGNDTFLTSMASVVSFLQARYSKLHAVGVSMGAVDLLNYMRRNPYVLASASLVAPVVKLDAVHDRNGLLGALIDAAYGSAAAYEVARPERDPWANTAPFTALPIQCFYGVTDETVLPSDVIDFAGTVECPLYTTTGTGHTPAGVPLNILVDFVRRH